jgi:hypothetical protein
VQAPQKLLGRPRPIGVLTFDAPPVVTPPYSTYDMLF